MMVTIAALLLLLLLLLHNFSNNTIYLPITEFQGCES